MSNKTGYFTTGEFARLFSISKQTLFYYDQIGIFQPEYTAENGYRYYSFTQIESFEVLLMFKELNVPLKEIREHMEHRSPEALICLLEKQRDVLDQRIRRLQFARNHLDQKIRITEEGRDAPLTQVIRKETAGETLILSEYHGNNQEWDTARAAAELYTFCHSHDLSSASVIGGMIPAGSIADDSYSYSCFYSVIDTPSVPEPESAMHWPGGDTLMIYDDQGYTRVPELCRILLSYAEEHGMTVSDTFREDIILDDLSVEGYYHYLVKVSVQVEG